MKKKKYERASASSILAFVDRLERIAKTLENLCKCIWGNGEPGLKAEVIAIKAKLEVFNFVLGGCVAGIIIPLIFYVLAKFFHITIGG